MNQAFALLFKENLASWLRAKGFALVLVAALVPAGLTAAWVYTHQGDIAVTAIEWDPQGPEFGDTVNITVTVENRFPRDAPPFDLEVRVGFYQQSPVDPNERTWRGVFDEAVEVDGLEAEGATQVQVQWTPGQRDLGTFLIEALVDPEEALRETQRVNNFRYAQIQVHSPGAAPTDLDEGAGDARNGTQGNETLPEADVRLVRLDHPPGLYVNEQVNLSVVAENRGPDDMENATLHFTVERERVSGSFVDGQVTDVQVDWVEMENETFDLALEADGEEEEFDLAFTPSQVTRYRVQAWVDLEGAAQDPDGEGHELERTFMVDRRDAFEEPPEGMTAKTFYQGLVLDLVHLKILIPLIAVFYAAGVLNDERRKNTLPYLFTRPVPRWALPITRFGVSFVVAGVAVTAGVLAVNAILLGQPGAQMEFLLWPLGLTLGALFVYGAVFTLLGVVTDRPYLWGVLYVLGAEFLIFVGRYVLFFNGRPLFQSWAEFLSLNHWFLQVFAAWDAERVAPWFETTSTSALVAGLGLAVVAVGSLVASAVAIRRKDLDV